MAIAFDPFMMPRALSLYMGVSILVISLAIVWTAIWKGIALWKSAKHGQMVWFIVMLITSTLGILDIIYILFFQRKERRRNRTRR